MGIEHGQRAAVDYELHARRARAGLQAEGLDGLIGTTPGAVTWLSGFRGTNGLAVLSGDEAFFLTDFRYQTVAEGLRDQWRVHIASRDLIASLAADLPMFAKPKMRIGFDARTLAYGDWRRLDEAARAHDVELVPTTGLLDRLRSVKDP